MNGACIKKILVATEVFICCTYTIALATDTPGIAKIGIMRTEPLYAEEIEKGFINKMKELGYIEGQNVHYVSNVVGSQNVDFKKNAETAEKMAKEGIDILVTIGTQASMPVWPVIKKTKVPMVFSGVTFPADCGLIQEFGKPTGENITGISYGVPPSTRLVLSRQILQDTEKYHRFAFIYCGSVPQEQMYVKELKSLNDTAGWQLEYVDYYNYENKKIDFDLLLRKLGQNRPDAIFGFFSLDNADPDQYKQLQNAYKGPIFGISSKQTDEGAIGGALTDHAFLGAQQAVMVSKILSGTSAGTIPPEQPMKYNIELNFKTAELLGIKFPSNVVASANRRVTK